MHARRDFIKIATLSLLLFGALKAPGQAWSPAGPTNMWFCVASSADGNKLIVGAGTLGLASGPAWQILTSTNAGTAWATNSLSPSFGWSSVACSADGTTMLALSPFEPIYLSTNSGSLWTTSSVPAIYNWSSAAMSGDGSTMVATVSKDDPVIFVSTNRGAEWISKSIIGMPGSTVACSADGSRLMILTTGLLYVSTNYGVDWLFTTHVGLNNKNSLIACSTDASKLAVAFQRDGIYTSTDFGVTWKSNNVPPQEWSSIASSADGTRLVAVAGFGLANGPVYTSTDAGIHWSSNNVPTLSWTGVASSADGGRLVACTRDSGIWQSFRTVAPQLDLQFSGSELNLSWIIPSTRFGLQHKDNLAADAWTDLTNPPAINSKNARYELSVTPTNAQNFYRLAQP